VGVARKGFKYMDFFFRCIMVDKVVKVKDEEVTLKEGEFALYQQLEEVKQLLIQQNLHKTRGPLL
jgi:hypothetical protein